MLIEDPTPKSSELSSKVQCFSLSEVANHDVPGDCWIIIYDRVYRITDFLNKHPGGNDLLLEYAGKDASIAFRETGHSDNAIQLLKQYEIGELNSEDKIFRISGNTSLRDLPE